MGTNCYRFASNVIATPLPVPCRHHVGHKELVEKAAHGITFNIIYQP
jgi:hypothetical protein